MFLNPTQYKDFLKNMQILLKGRKSVEISIHNSMAELSLFSCDAIIDFSDILGADSCFDFVLSNRLLSDLKAIRGNKGVKIVLENNRCLFTADKTVVYAPRSTVSERSFFERLTEIVELEPLFSVTLGDEIQNMSKLGKGQNFIEIIACDKAVKGFKLETSFISLTEDEIKDKEFVFRSSAPLFFPPAKEYLLKIYCKDVYLALWEFTHFNCRYNCIEQLDVAPINFGLF
ncbi:MAG: hypothetical protein QW835_00310 [Candidatus Hadarchaeum sp.]